MATKDRKERTVKPGADLVDLKKVLYLNLPADVAMKLAAEAESEDRPMSVQAARILKQYFDAKK